MTLRGGGEKGGGDGGEGVGRRGRESHVSTSTPEPAEPQSTTQLFYFLQCGLGAGERSGTE